MITKVMRDFLRMEASGGVILLMCAILAVMIVNSDFNVYYYSLLLAKIPLDIPALHIYKDMDIKTWINDGLMPIFFLLVGLELKREIVRGELSSKSKIILPMFAAIAGVVVPAIIYFNINSVNQDGLRGWAIPTATDIAFAVGILHLFGNKVSNSLKVFLIALAIIDDLIAILIIALFYSKNIHIVYLDLAILVTVFLFIVNKLKVTNLTVYLLAGLLLWVLILQSGIHATIAGVILAFFIPISPKKDKRNIHSPLHILERHLYFPVSYIILPIFAFANSGVDFSGLTYAVLFDEVVLGIALGLFIGKQFGIVMTVFLFTKVLKISPFFSDASWLEFYGVALLTGIGFTMSLFIGGLAFATNNHLADETVIGVMLGSILSGVCGFMVILCATQAKDKQ